MKFGLKSVVFSLLIFLTVPAAFAGIEESFEKIRDNSRHYRDPGTICEEIAREEFQEKYPEPRYSVLVGVAYSSNGRTLGELDMVILDNNSQRVTLVGEVKCYSDLKKGLSKAKQQRKRFLSSLGQNLPLKFIDLDSEQEMSPTLFKGVTEFISVSQKGGKNIGFDHELEHSLDEMSQLRDRMIQCQRQNLCPTP